MKSRKKGFTLIELLVVIAIIGILATIILVTYSNLQAKSRDSKRKGDLQAISSSLELYYADHKAYPVLAPANKAFDLNYGDRTQGAIDGYENLNSFLTGGYITNHTSPRDPKFSSNSYHYFILSVANNGYKIITDPRNLIGGVSMDSYEASGDVEADCISRAGEFADRSASADSFSGNPSPAACFRLQVTKNLSNTQQKISTLDAQTVTW